MLNNIVFAFDTHLKAVGIRTSNQRLEHRLKEEFLWTKRYQKQVSDTQI